MKAPEFEKELPFLVPYIFAEETRQSNISSPSTLSQDEQSNDNMDSQCTDIANEVRLEIFLFLHLLCTQNLRLFLFFFCSSSLNKDIITISSSSELLMLLANQRPALK
jgi:hypothetical protein